MSQQHPITPPPPHLLKKFSAQAQAEANKRNGTGYLKTVATLCIEWFVNSQSTSNDRQIRSSEIEPPRELVEQWVDMLTSRSDQAVFTMAAQWGADQELEACCEWLARNYNYPRADHPLRAARRPKPPSLKEQALKALTAIEGDFNTVGDRADTIRRALEALDD
jgi:hypothetical protein